MTPINPCPSCGKAPNILTEEDFIAGPPQYRVCCFRFECSEKPETRLRSTMAEAINDWNAREFLITTKG